MFQTNLSVKYLFNSGAISTSHSLNFAHKGNSWLPFLPGTENFGCTTSIRNLPTTRCQNLNVTNWKFPKLKVAKIESSQFWKLPKLKVSSAFLAKLPSCHIAMFPSCKVAKLQVAKLWTCDHGAKFLSFLFSSVHRLGELWIETWPHQLKRQEQDKNKQD